MQLFKNFCDYTLDKNGVLGKVRTKRYCCSVDKCS